MDTCNEFQEKDGLNNCVNGSRWQDHPSCWSDGEAKAMEDSKLQDDKQTAVETRMRQMPDGVPVYP